MNAPESLNPATPLKSALANMEIPLLTVEAVAGLLLSLETSSLTIEPHHLMPLTNALSTAADTLRAAYDDARQVAR